MQKKFTTPIDSPSEIQQEENNSNIINEIFSLPNTVVERPKFDSFHEFLQFRGHSKDEKSKKSKTRILLQICFLYVDNSDPKLRKKRKMSKSAKTKNEYYDAL